MTSLLVDSDILIEVSRGRSHALVAEWREVANRDAMVAVSPVSVAELWHGVRGAEAAALEWLLAGLLCLPAEAATGRRAGDYLRRYHASHGVELGDALIAAAAVQHELPLWTRNRRHYPMPELKFFD